MELKLSDPEYYKNYNMAEDIEKEPVDVAFEEVQPDNTEKE